MVEQICEKSVLSMEWNSECVMEGESGEQVEDKLESVTSSFMICARLTERDRKLIEEMRWRIAEWERLVIFREDVDGRQRMNTDEELNHEWLNRDQRVVFLVLVIPAYVNITETF